MSNTKAFALIGSIGVLSGLSATAIAQTGVTAPNPNADVAKTAPHAPVIEEMVVTARRRDESLQTVPVAIAALNSEALQNASVQEMENLTAVVPGFRFTYEGGGNNISMSLRGLSVVPLGEGIPAVVIYSSDVPLPKVGGNLPTYDLASVQVLKGPQGTLFGRNTIGGAVLLTPNAPSYHQDGYFRVGLGNYNGRTFEGAANIPLVEDKAALRVAAQIRKRDGRTENLTPGAPDLDSVDQKSYRVSLLLDPSENLTNRLVADYSRVDQAPNGQHIFGYNPGIIQGAFTPSLGPTIAAAYEQAVKTAIEQGMAVAPFRVYDNTNTSGAGKLGYTTDLWGIANTTEYKMGDTTIRNILGYRNVSSAISANTQGFGDVTGPLGPLVVYKLASLDEKEYFTEEFQVLGKADRLDWIGGAFYSKDRPTGGMGTSSQAFNLTAFGVVNSHSTSLTTNENYALFGQLGYQLTDALKLNAGARYSWDKIETCGASGRPAYLSPSECDDLGSTVKNSGKAPTWTLGLDYKLSDSVFTYITHRRGYRSVNVNAPLFYTARTTGGSDPACIVGGGICPDLRPFQKVDEEKINDLEVGVKSDWTLGEVAGRTNLALFHTKYTNAVQFASIAGVIPPSTPDAPNRSSVAINAADITINGAELELTISPVSDLTFTLSGAYIEQKIDSLNAPAITGIALNEKTVTLPTPRFTGTAAVRYVLPFTPLGAPIAFNADYYYSSKWDAQSGIALPSYDVVNTRLDWSGLMSGAVDVSLWCRNLLDKDYWAAAGALQPSLPAQSAFLGDPRTYGVELTYHF
ncbi:MAG: hypothetical protein JWM78_1686 [Verrucomicrobiaceae bacterium]|nr:hypothetical protein [Verrucomicrobiaceae bacterium]